MQVDPIKSTLKAPGTKRLKLKHDKPLSSFAFNFNLRCYIMAFDYALGRACQKSLKPSIKTFRHLTSFLDFNMTKCRKL